MLNRGGIGETKRQRRFPESRTSGHDDQVRALESTRELVEVAESGGHSNQRVALLAALTEAIEESFEDLVDFGNSLVNRRWATPKILRSA